MTTENTVQLIPEKVFETLSGNWYGPVSYGQSGEFQYAVKVQPVKYEGKVIAFGLHKTKETTEFVLFNTGEPFAQSLAKKNTIVIRIAGGEIIGSYGKEKYYNRLVEPANKKVLFKPDIFRAFSEVMHTFDLITRSYHIDKMPKELPVSELLRVEPFTMPVELPLVVQ